MGDAERKWLENFRQINGLNNTRGCLNNIQPPLPITFNRPRKPHRLSALIDLTRVDVLLGRFRREPKRAQNKNDRRVLPNGSYP